MIFAAPDSSAAEIGNSSAAKSSFDPIGPILAFFGSLLRQGEHLVSPLGPYTKTILFYSMPCIFRRNILVFVN
jgi:hypothetical protein